MYKYSWTKIQKNLSIINGFERKWGFPYLLLKMLSLSIFASLADFLPELGLMEFNNTLSLLIYLITVCLGIKLSLKFKSSDPEECYRG